MEILEQIETQVKHIEALKSQVIKPKLIPLMTNIEGFISPQTFGVYRHTGGEPLGVVGNQFRPQDLEQFLDSIQQSVLECGLSLDLSKLEYLEFKGGAKVSFKLPLKSYTLKTKQVGDIVDSFLMFKTGFDGLTKTSIAFHVKRLVCLNGATNSTEELALSFKNTQGNAFKAQIFCNEIVKTIESTENYIAQLNALAKVKITKEQQNAFVTALTGYDLKKWDELNTAKRNILAKINEAIAIEAQTLDLNAFALLQGVTRYVTHELGKGNEFSYQFDNPKKLNDVAHKLTFAMAN